MVTWTTRDGRQIKVSKMSDRHLENALKFMKRVKENNTDSLMHSYSFYGFLQGDLSVSYMEQELDILEDRALQINYWISVFKAEIERRAQNKV